jgi:hypothetical protein
MSLKQLCRIKLFTRQNCSLCVNARSVLDSVRAKRPFDLQIFDIMKPENEKWKIYEFDVPVVSVFDARDSVTNCGRYMLNP